MARQLAPEGTYYGVITKQGFNTAKGDGEGTPYFGITIRLTEKDDDFGNRVKLPIPLKREIKNWLTGPAMKITIANLRHLDFNDKDMTKLDPWSDPEKFHSFIDKPVVVDISHKVNVNPKTQKEEVQESVWLSKQKAKLNKEQTAAVLSRTADLFAAQMAEQQENAAAKTGVAPAAPDTSFDHGDNVDPENTPEAPTGKGRGKKSKAVPY